MRMTTRFSIFQQAAFVWLAWLGLGVVHCDDRLAGDMPSHSRSMHACIASTYRMGESFDSSNVLGIVYGGLGGWVRAHDMAERPVSPVNLRRNLIASRSRQLGTWAVEGGLEGTKCYV